MLDAATIICPKCHWTLAEKPIESDFAQDQFDKKLGFLGGAVKIGIIIPAQLTYAPIFDDWIELGRRHA